MERRLAAILAADVVGYSRLMSNQEEGTLVRLKAYHDEVAAPTIAKHKGRIVKLMGDGLLAEFASVVDAVRCAVEIQEAMREHSADQPEDQRIQLRIGINLGDVIIDGEDIYGDGVNIAARLEGLAEVGGICISRMVFDQVKGKVEIGFADLGAQKVKNIPEPVQTFKVLLDSPTTEHTIVATPTAKRTSRWPMVAGGLIALVLLSGALLWLRPWESTIEPISVEAMAFPQHDGPSIAVLPFANMSDDPAQEYFVDGMTEDLITDLAKIENLFVIARNTVFTYKGKSVVVPDVARELGVKYVMEGSVRRVGDVVRINAQLIDGASGAHIWAERYDGVLTDIFALQDKVTSEIIAQLQLTLTPDERNRRESGGTDNPDAHDAYLRGWQLYRRYTAEDFAEAIPHLKRAVELDPDYGQAWAALASIYWNTYRKGYAWSSIVNPDPANAVSWVGSRDKAEIHLKQAMRNPTPLAHQIESQVSWDYRQFDRALREAGQAVALNHNDPAGHLALAWAQFFAGNAEAAIASAEIAMRLDPSFPGSSLYALGAAQLMLERYEEAQATLQRALAFRPNEIGIMLPLSIAYARTSQQAKAKAALQKFSENLTLSAPKIETFMPWWPFRRETDVRFFGGGLIKAGLCCEKQFEAYVENLRQGGTLE